MTPLATQPSLTGSDAVNASALDIQLRILVTAINKLVQLVNRVRAARLGVADGFEAGSVRYRMFSSRAKRHLAELVRLLVSIQAQAAIIPATLPAQALGGGALVGATLSAGGVVLLSHEVPAGRWAFTVSGEGRAKYRLKLRMRAVMGGTYGAAPAGAVYDTTGGTRGLVAATVVAVAPGCDHLWVSVADDADPRFHSLNWTSLGVGAIAPQVMDRWVELIVGGGAVITIGYDNDGPIRAVPLSATLPPDDDPRFPYRPKYRSTGALQIDLVMIEPYTPGCRVNLSEPGDFPAVIQLPMGGFLSSPCPTP